MDDAHERDAVALESKIRWLEAELAVTRAERDAAVSPLEDVIVQGKDMINERDALTAELAATRAANEWLRRVVLECEPFLRDRMRAPGDLRTMMTLCQERGYLDLHPEHGLAEPAPGKRGTGDDRVQGAPAEGGEE